MLLYFFKAKCQSKNYVKSSSTSELNISLCSKYNFDTLILLNYRIDSIKTLNSFIIFFRNKWNNIIW